MNTIGHLPIENWMEQIFPTCWPRAHAALGRQVVSAVQCVTVLSSRYGNNLKREREREREMVIPLVILQQPGTTWNASLPPTLVIQKHSGMLGDCRGSTWTIWPHKLYNRQTANHSRLLVPFPFLSDQKSGASVRFQDKFRVYNWASLLGLGLSGGEKERKDRKDRGERGSGDISSGLRSHWRSLIDNKDFLSAPSLLFCPLPPPIPSFNISQSFTRATTNCGL